MSEWKDPSLMTAVRLVDAPAEMGQAKLGGKVLPIGTPGGLCEVALRLTTMRSPSISRPRRMIAGMITIGSKITKAKFGGKVLPVGMP